jgi:hypothetical protein
MKRFCTVGHCVTYAAALEREAALREGSATILASESTIPDIEHEIYYQVVGLAQPCRSVGIRRAQKVVAVAGVKTAKEDEWMYTLNEGESKDPFSKINAGFDALLSGDVNGVKRMMESIEAHRALENESAAARSPQGTLAARDEIAAQAFQSLQRSVELGLPHLSTPTPKLNIV